MRTLTCVGLVALISCLSLGSAAAGSLDGFMSGNKLYELCTDKRNLYSSGMCMGYVLGIIDEISTVRSHNHLPPCSFDGITAGQVEDLVTKFLRDHPEYRQGAASGLSTAAIGDAWCGTAKK